MSELIHIQPARHLRVAFARWAVAQLPKVDTVSESEFGVPPLIFTDMPEDLLRGALVDGHPYVSPLDQEETEPAPAGAPELTGVATLDGLREAVPGQPLPEVPASAYGPDSVPLDFAPLEDAPASGEEELHATGDPDEDAAAMVAATSPETVERAMSAVLLAMDLAATNAARNGDTAGDDGGDTSGDQLAGGEDAAADTAAVTSEDTPGDNGVTAKDSRGDSDSSDPGANSFPCPRCPRSFTSSRGREVHLRRAHA